MPLPPLSDAAWNLWAKSDKNYGDGRWLPVVAHLLDVAACAWEILNLEPERTLDLFAADYGLDREGAQRWVCALAGLHDLGKASPAFQGLWKEGAARTRRFLSFAEPPLPEPHGKVTQDLLWGLLEDPFGWPAEVAQQVADAVGCHHGRRSWVNGLPEAQCGDEKWRDAQFELTRAVLVALQVPPAPQVSCLSGPAFMRLAGLTSFADWVGSSFEVPPTPDELARTDPAAYFERAQEKARQKLREIGWTKREPLRAELPSIETVFSYIPGFSPRDLQREMAELHAGLDERPTLTIVEAPMGEGKTEAALYTFLQRQNAAGHRGLYVALPTQATGNAMFTRLSAFLKAQGRATPPDLQLLHGGTLLNETYQAELKRTRTLLHPRGNVDGDPAEAPDIRAEGWFSIRKRALLSEYGVGTVDQALLGVLNVPHQFVRLWGLGNRVVVLDEVHAYDTYTSELIYALLRWLRALGSSAVVMSATLPATSRARLLDTWRAAPGPEAAYPRLTLAREGEAAQTRTIAASSMSRTVALRPIAADVKTVADQAVALAASGGCVAVIVNTVQRAQEVCRAVIAGLEAAGEAVKTPVRGVKKGTDAVCVLLFHARYPARDRAKREGLVLRLLGREGSRPRRCILIATQVAEQSLDFDADVLLSDLAPIDLLLQRAGRLHRHEHNAERRHGHTQPVLYVAGLDAWPDAAMEDHAWQWVYAPHLLYRSWLALANREEVALPADLDALVQRVYARDWVEGDLTPERAEQVAAARRTYETRVENEGQHGQDAPIGSPEGPLGMPQAYRPDSDGEPVSDDAGAQEKRPTTRLGEESVRIVPLHRVDGTYFLDPQGRDSARLNGRTLSPETARHIYSHSLQVSAWPLVRLAAEKAPPHPAWQKDALLQTCIPVVLEGGQAQFGNLTVTLDPEFGLVYERG
ncbi:CRISPR-associated helicase/endonuclease Cas3 [Deinococcus sp. YIM 77859]|uniref:CRISPR-associated helicase/endonuclease Cas3 n=1 Tax=Deinococcus sp. YIM 77859 TaxID=1540221 RepID=UPI0005540232|nr:CRISPR-associated helicase/endonuclease Cas3 [Deinococcus sp. YIM 77859]